MASMNQEDHSASPSRGTNKKPSDTAGAKVALVLFSSGLIWPLLIVGMVQENDTMILIALSLLTCLIVGVISIRMKRSGALKRRNHAVWTTGTAGLATITRIGTKGGEFNDHPYVDISMKVSLAEETPTFLAECHVLISKLAIPRIQPNCEISVRVDPNDHSFVVVDPELTPYGYN